jgi:hypothetical protein
MRVAVMQPYFYPYGGYFRLLLAADVFLVFDCVQFPRRGRVHRSQLDAGNPPSWLTLPLAKQPQDTRIQDLRFSDNAEGTFRSRLDEHPWIEKCQGECAEQIRLALLKPKLDVTTYLIEQIRTVASLLQLPADIRRTSELRLSPDLQASQRVIAAVQAVGGRHYVNSPGGRALYHPSEFAQAGLQLSFLSHYRGAYPFLLRALLEEPATSLRRDIRACMQLEP